MTDGQEKQLYEYLIRLAEEDGLRNLTENVTGAL